MMISGRTLQNGSVLILLLTLSIGAVSAEGRFQELSLETKTQRTKILPWEGLRVEVVLRNATGQAVSGFTSWSTLRLYLALESQPFEQLDPRFNETCDSSTERTTPLPAGFQDTRSRFLWWGDTSKGKGLPFFSQPGVYYLKAVLEGRDASLVESNAARIEVVEPDERHSAAWLFLRRQAVGEQFFFSVRSLPEANRRSKVSELKAFAAQYPNCRYAAYAWYAIAMGCYGAKDYAEAELALEQVLGEKDFPLAEDVLYYLVNISVKNRDLITAEERLAALCKSYPESRLTKGAVSEVARAKREQ